MIFNFDFELKFGFGHDVTKNWVGFCVKDFFSCSSQYQIFFSDAFN